MPKRYYWLKLHDDFFNSKRIKKLRRLSGGDTFLIIYLKMQLLAIHDDGFIKYSGIEGSFAEELALDLDEDADNVAITLSFLQSVGLLEISDNIEYFLPYAVENTGSETASAQRVRDFRKTQKALHCNNDVTKVKRECNAEIEKEKEIEKEIDIDNMADKSAKRFIPPTIDEVDKYCRERNNSVDAETFVDFYSSKGWMVGRNKMKDWKSAVRTWEKSERQRKPKDDFLEFMREAQNDKV